MTARKRLKRLVRARAAKTGESYTSALRYVRNETPKERDMTPPTDRPPARCSFCGKYQDQVRKLIAGPGVFICDECVLLCQDIIEPVGGERPPTPEPAAPTPDVDGRIRRYLAEAIGPLASRIDVATLTHRTVRVDVHTPRPGAVIGRHGETADALRSALAEIVGADVALNVVEVPEEPPR